MKIDFYTRYKKAFSKYEDYLEKVLEPCTCGSESVECIMALFSMRLICISCDRAEHVSQLELDQTDTDMMIESIVNLWNGG